LTKYGASSPASEPGDDPLVGHHLQHEVAALARRARVRLRVVASRVGGDAGEERGLGQVEPLRRASEVDARGLLDAVRAVPEVDRVQVLGEDLVLRPMLLQLPGQRGLAKLPRE